MNECKGKTPLTVGQAIIPYGIDYFAIDINVQWATGMNTVEINQITVVPHPPPAGDALYHWALRVQGMFTGLQVWAKAKIKGSLVLDGYACCKNPFHFSFQISAACTQERAFFGNAEVDSLILDPVEITNMLVLPQIQHETAMIMIDAGNATSPITKAIRQMLANYLTGKPSGLGTDTEEPQTTTPSPHGRHFNITDMINQVVKYNGGHRCPQLPPTTTTTTLPSLNQFGSPESWDTRRSQIFQ